MFRQQIIILLISISLCCQFSFSQEKEPKKDSLKVYKNLQSYSKKHKFTKFVHKLIFKPINSKQKRTKKVIRQNYQVFEGKIIRKINIVTLDPFGYSEIDTTTKPRNWIEKNGNRMVFIATLF